MKYKTFKNMGTKHLRVQRGISLTLALVSIAALSGCTSRSAPNTESEPTVTIQLAETEPATIPSSEAEQKLLFTEIDPYVMRTDKSYFLTDEDRAYARKLLDAVFAREETVQLSEDYDANLRVLRAMRENPYWFFIEYEAFIDNNTGLRLDYTFSAEDQAVLRNCMDEEYLDILNTIIQPDMNDVDKALAVHHYFGQRIQYDYDWPDGFYMADEKFLHPDMVIYGALYSGKGVCSTYSYLCEFALYELGIECLRFTDALHGNEEEGHMWLLVKLDGDYYHMDTTWDGGTETGQVGLEHFGMTDEERREDGFDMDLYNSDSSYHGFSCTNPRFQILRDVVDYEYIGNHLWKLYTADGNEAFYHSELGLQS